MSQHVEGAPPPRTPSAHPDRPAFLARVCLGDDPSDLAQELKIPKSDAEQWLRDPECLLEMSELRAWLVNSYRANGAALVSSAISTLTSALPGDPELAAKIVIASGILTSIPDGTTPSPLEERLRTLESAGALRFRQKVADQGMTEDEYWFLLTGSRQPPAPRPRGRPKKYK